MVLCICLLAIGLLITNFGTISTNELQFDLAKVLTPPYIEGLCNISTFRVTRFNRTSYVLNVEYENFVDIDENYEIEVKIYYNRLNNNQYNLSPMRIPRSPYCAVAQKFYPMLASSATNDTSNMYDSDGRACPREKVRITLHGNQDHFVILYSFLFFLGTLLYQELNYRWQ